MSLNIVDLNAENIKGCAVFDYRGWTISCSTVFRWPDVWASNPENTAGQHFVTVEEAIEFVNSQVKR